MGDKTNSDINILVVDDEVDLADTVKDFLSSAGYAATQAYSGEEALAKFHEGDFRLVITDLKMPGIDGMELLEKIKRIDKKVAVIVFTGYGTIESAIKAIKAGAYDYLEKPVHHDKLRIVVERALENSALSRQLGIFKGMTLMLLLCIPLWLILGIVLAMLRR